MNIALITCAEMPNLDDDDRRLMLTLLEAGAEVSPVVWADTRVDWGRFDVAIIRSTWDYHLRRDEFLAFVDSVSEKTNLWNPAPVVRWNTHKGYLRELSERGVSTVPTHWLSAGSTVALQSVLSDRDWPDAIVKPAIGAGAHGFVRVRRENANESQPHLDGLLSKGDVLVQPYLRSAQEGELSMVCIDGQFSHAVRCHLSGGLRKNGSHAVTPVRLSDEEREFARDVLRKLGAETLYARVDVLRDDEGSLRLLELELVEPTLYLGFSEEAAARMSAAIRKRE